MIGVAIYGGTVLAWFVAVSFLSGRGTIEDEDYQVAFLVLSPVWPLVLVSILLGGIAVKVYGWAFDWGNRRSREDTP